MARLVSHNSEDSIATDECQNYFVSPLCTKTTGLFEEEVKKDIISHATGLMQMDNLIQGLLKYKGRHPICVCTPFVIYTPLTNSESSANRFSLMGTWAGYPALLEDALECLASMEDLKGWCIELQ